MVLRPKARKAKTKGLTKAECKNSVTLIKNQLFTGVIANKDWLAAVNESSYNVVWQFHEQRQNSLICCYNTIDKTLRNITRGVNKAD